MTQRSAEGVVDPLCAGVRHDLGGQTRQQPTQPLGIVALQREEDLELAYDPFYDLVLARGPAPIGLRPRDSFDIAVDGTGSAYVTGWTESFNFRTTTGAFDTNFNRSGNADAFVTKLPTG